MKWRNLGLVTGVFLALAAFVYFYEIKGEKRREEAAEKEKKVFQFEEKDIASIAIKTPQEEIVLQRDKDAWKLTKPIETKADKSTADSIASEQDLEQLSDSEALNAIAAHLKDRELRCKMQAARALAKLGGKARSKVPDLIAIRVPFASCNQMPAAVVP